MASQMSSQVQEASSRDKDLLISEVDIGSDIDNTRPCEFLVLNASPRENPFLGRQ